ncbi:MAG: peptidoglycan-binding domain-containing protein [Pseudomonadota bacterium]
MQLPIFKWIAVVLTIFTIARGDAAQAYSNYKPFLPQLSNNELVTLIKQYYHSRGEWAGIFRMGSVNRMMIGPDAGGGFYAHVRYNFSPIPNNRAGRTDSGSDQRRFLIEVRNGRYSVVFMDEYNSACFVCNGNVVTLSPNHSRNVRKVQEALNVFGFNAGFVDGDVGTQTREAVKSFQETFGWPKTGNLTQEEYDLLVDGHLAFSSGGSGKFPEVLAKEGPLGYLKAYKDPSYADRFRQAAVAPPANGQSSASAGTSDQTTLLPSLQFREEPASASMLERCDIVALTTGLNGGPIAAENMSDADQALSEIFCEARPFVMSMGSAVQASSGASEAALSAACKQINTQMSEIRSSLDALTPRRAAASAAEINSALGIGEIQAASGYGRICAAEGYRTDNASMALSGLLVLVGSGADEFGELIGHHLREGFGPIKDEKAARNWYVEGLQGIADANPPSILPSFAARRMAVIRTALGAL